MKFRKIARFNYKDKRFQLFMSESNKAAYLEIKDDEFYYPELRDLLEINYLFNCSREIQRIKSEKIKYFNFVPKALRYGMLITLSSAFLAGCGARSNNSYTHYPYVKESSVLSEESTDTENTLDAEANNTIDKNTESNGTDKYLKLLAAADDENDFRYASDYEDLNIVKYLYVRDAKNYDKLYGYSMVSEDDIKDAVNRNGSITKDFKDFIVQYVHGWNILFPGSDFSTLYHNLIGDDNFPPLKVKACTKDEMRIFTKSLDSVACYIKEDNTIYVLEGIDLSCESDDFIVMSHELTHAARYSYYKRDDGYKVFVSFYDKYELGMFTEEALITDFCYELQGLGKKSNFYTLQSSYFRIILDAIDYNGADFMNHSINYLFDKMDEYMGDEQYAYHAIALLEAEASLRYTPYLEPELSDFTDLYKYLTRMFVKNNINSDMSYEDAKSMWDVLEDELTYYFDQVKNPIELDLSIFKNEFDSCIEELGLMKTSGLSR